MTPFDCAVTKRCRRRCATLSRKISRRSDIGLLIIYFACEVSTPIAAPCHAPLRETALCNQTSTLRIFAIRERLRGRRARVCTTQKPSNFAEKNHDNFTAGLSGSLSNAGRGSRDGDARCRCCFREGSRARWLSCTRYCRTGRFGSRLPSLPRHAARIAALSRVRRRSAANACPSAAYPRTDAPTVAADGCGNRLARAWRYVAASLGESGDPLGLHLSAAVHRARPRAVSRSAVGGGKAWRRHQQCAPRTAPAGNPLRQRTGRLAASLCAGFADRRSPHQASPRADALEGNAAHRRLSVPRYRAGPGRECHRRRPQHPGTAPRADGSAGRRPPQ